MSAVDDGITRSSLLRDDRSQCSRVFAVAIELTLLPLRHDREDTEDGGNGQRQSP